VVLEVEPVTAPASGRVRRTLNREQLLRAVADHILQTGLHAFTLRQAAAAAGTTHKVLLYHFGSTAALVTEAVDLIRADAHGPAGEMTAALAADVDQALPALWHFWVGQPAPLAEVLALAIADPESYGEAGRRATEELRRNLAAALPADLPDERRDGVSTLLLAVLRGLVIDLKVTRDEQRVAAAYALFVQLAKAAVRAGGADAPVSRTVGSAGD
jgi:AcrR family transcriptional regulator